MERCEKCGQRVKNPVHKVKCLGCRKLMKVGGGRMLGKRRNAQFCSGYCRLKAWRKQAKISA